jgi:hypothetical protein
MLARSGTKVLVVDKERHIFNKLSQNRLFEGYITQQRLHLLSDGIMNLPSLRDDQLFYQATPSLELPTQNEISIMKDVFKKMLQNQLKNPPKECTKFARQIETLVKGHTSNEFTVNKLTLIVLSECFANGVIENDLIYQQISIGAVKDIKDLSAIEQIRVN